MPVRYVTWSITLVISLTDCLLIWRRRHSKPDARTYHVAVALHRIRRRHQVFQFKVATRRYAAYARNQMLRELRELRRKGSEP
jgi:hypothetical protein